MNFEKDPVDGFAKSQLAPTAAWLHCRIPLEPVSLAVDASLQNPGKLPVDDLRPTTNTHPDVSVSEGVDILSSEPSQYSAGRLLIILVVYVARFASDAAVGLFEFPDRSTQSLHGSVFEATGEVAPVS